MFVSEVGEAIYCGLIGVDWEQVNESNKSFATIVSHHINYPVDVLFEKVLQEYHKLAQKNPIARYNLERLHFNSDIKEINTYCNTISK